MALSSTSMKKSKVDTMKFIRDDTCDEPKYKIHLETTTQKNKVGALSTVPPRVLLVSDIRLFYHCKIMEIGDYELREYYEELSNDGNIKVEFKHLET